MQGSLQRLVDMFTGGDTCLVIPVYQRNYDWKVENCARLFDDLVETIREERPSHFFGSIVYKDEGAIGEATIIDGQQRLTTVNLLFLALHNGLGAGQVSARDPHLRDRVFKEYLQSEYSASGHKLKLKPVKADAAAYAKLFGDPAFYDDDSNVTANYRYFVQRLRDGGLTGDEVFDAIRRLQVMKLKLEESDDAQLIFESLNSTGLDLSEADMIRNYVLMGRARSDQEHLYENFWNRMEQNVGYDTSRFIRHYLTSKLGRTPRITQLYEQFKHYIKVGQQDIPTLLRDMRDYSAHFRDLRQATTGDVRTDRLLRRYNLVDRDVTVPLLLPVLAEYRAGTIDAADLQGVIRAVDNYLTRRFVCGYPTNALNKIFALLYRETAKLRGSTDTFSDVMTYQLMRRQGSGTFPSDQEFTDALRTKDFYHISTAQRTYLIDSLENRNSNDVRDIAAALQSGAISVEHIMPQTLTPEWRSDLGPDHERIHETWLHRLANLTVTGYNSTYSNLPFVRKRDREDGFRASPYRLNGLLREAQHWGEAELKQRSDWFVEAALSYWRTPVSRYQPRPDAKDVEPMGDDTDFTGRTLRAWEFEGVQHPVTTWKQMTLEVVAMLADMDPAGLHRAARENVLMRLRPNPATPLEAYQQEAVPGITVQVANTTSTKAWILRDLFHRLGLETDELVFHLAPAEGPDDE